MADGTTETRGRDSETIRRDIERRRADMDETVDELSDRLSPGRLVDEAWQRIRSGEGSGLSDMLRDHPVPIALMGLGLGWLAVEQATGRSVGPDGHAHDGPGTWAPAEGRRGPYRSDAVDHDDPDWEHAGKGTKLKAKASEAGEAADGLREKASSAASSVKERASSAASSVKEKTSDAAHAVRDRVSDAAHSASDSAHSAADRARERGTEMKDRARSGARRAGEKTRQGFWTIMEENPMAMGAIAFGLGLASGVSAPSSPVEDRLMGRTSDTLKDEAKRVAKESSEKAKHVLEDASEAAVDEMERQSDQRDIGGRTREARDAMKESAHHAREAAEGAAAEVKEAAKEVGRAAKDAAKSRAEEEDLTGAGLKAEAKKAGQRTKRQAGNDARAAKSKVQSD